MSGCGTFELLPDLTGSDKQAAKSALQKDGMAQGICSRCSGRNGLQSVLRIREERFCPPCVGAHLRSRASRGPGGMGSARGAALASGSKRVLLAHSGRSGGAALLRLTADFFHTDPLTTPAPAEEEEQQTTHQEQSNSQPPDHITQTEAPEPLMGELMTGEDDGDEDDDDDLFGPAPSRERKTQLNRGPPRELDWVDVVHIDCSALRAGTQEEVLQNRSRRVSPLQKAVDEQNSLVAERAERPYRLLVLGIEDVYAPDDELLAFTSGKPVAQPSLQAWDATLNDAPPTSPSTASGLEVRMAAIRYLFAQVLGTTAIDKSAQTRAESLCQVLVDSLLRRLASLGSYAALLYGTSATRHAVSFLGGLAAGAGAKLSVSHASKVWYTPLASSSSDKLNRVLLVRPLAETAAKESAYFVRHFGLRTLLPQDLDASFLSSGRVRAPTVPSTMSSIDRLTSSFVQALERGVSSTSSTVGGITGKLALPEQGLEEQPFNPLGINLHGALQHKFLAEALDAATWIAAPSQACAFCMLPRGENDAQSWRDSISITTLRSQPDPDAPTNKSFASHLCYACTVLLTLPEAPTFALPAHVGRSLVPTPSDVHVPEESADKDGCGVGSCGNCGCGSSSASGQSNGHASHHGASSQRAPMRKVGRDEIKAQLSGFLLPEEE